jgi:ABC-type nitrate/sulfonate/bicarbonate transport system substrate-binding protein
MDDFIMGLANANLSTMYLYVGKEQGFFAKENIDLKLLIISASIAPAALIARQIDGMAYASSGILLRSRGAPVLPVFLESQKPGWFLMSTPSITHLQQLTKKTVSVGALGAAAHKITVDILKKHGVNAEGVAFVGGRGGSQTRLQMLLSGVVQAANLNPPFNFVGEKQGLNTLLYYGDHFDLAQNGVIVHESTLKSRRPFLKRMLRALVRSHLYTLHNRSATINWIVNNLKLEPQIAEKTFDFTLAVSTRSGKATEQAIQNALLDQEGSTSGTVTKTGDLVDYSVLDEVLSELKVK